MKGEDLREAAPLFTSASSDILTLRQQRPLYFLQQLCRYGKRESSSKPLMPFVITDASQHGVPRVAPSGCRDAAKERKKIEEYQSLVELVNAKVHAIFIRNSNNTNSLLIDIRTAIYGRSACSDDEVALEEP